MRRWLPVLSLSALLLSPLVEAEAADLYGGGSDLPEELRSLLSASDPARRREAVDRLLSLPQHLANPYLLQRLQDGDPAVRARAAQALGPASVLAAASPLLDGMSDADHTVRAACAEALGQYGALPRPEQQRAVALLARAMGDGQFEVRQEALRAVERLLASQVFTALELPQLLPPVLLRIEDENVGVRRSALAVLGRLSPLSLPAELRSRVVLALLGRLSDPARDVRAESLRSLGLLRATHAASAALRLLRDPSEEVRKQAMLCLGRLASATAIPLLREALDSGTDGQRAAALQALGLFLLPDAAQSLPTEALSQATQAILANLTHATLRPLVIDSLLAGSQSVVPLLLQELSRPALSLEQLAALVELIRDLGPKLSTEQRATAQSELVRELYRQRLPREHILDALAVVGDRNITPLLTLLLGDKDLVVRRRATQLLRKPHLADPRAFDALVAASTDADPQVRHQALLALGDLGLGQPRLTEVLDPSDRPMLADVDTRQVAAQALAQLVRKASLEEPTVAMLLRAVVTVRPGPSERRTRRTAAQVLAGFLSSHPERQAPIIAELLSVLRKSPEGGPHSEVLLLLSGMLRGRKSETVRERLLGLGQLAAEPQSAEGQLAVDALSALQSFVDVPAQGRLVKLLQHRDPARQLRATAALGSLLATAPSEALVSALLTRLQDGSSDDLRGAAEAAWALSNLPRNHESVARVLERLRLLLSNRHEPSPERTALRTNVMAALARLGVTEPRDAEWLDDADAGVRRNAALLLSAVVPRSGGIEARLRSSSVADEDRHVRHNAQAALLGKGPHAATSRKHWLVTYQTDFDGNTRPLAPYRLLMGDGLSRVGFTDRVGTTVDELLPDGPCEVELLPTPAPPR